VLHDVLVEVLQDSLTTTPNIDELPPSAEYDIDSDPEQESDPNSEHEVDPEVEHDVDPESDSDSETTELDLETDVR
jgi:hypothetical protein